MIKPKFKLNEVIAYYCENNMTYIQVVVVDAFYCLTDKCWKYNFDRCDVKDVKESLIEKLK